MKKIKNTSFSINTLIHLFVHNKNKNMYNFFLKITGSVQPSNKTINLTDTAYDTTNN